jgi:hypothetical protein
VDFASKKLGRGIAPAEFRELVEITIVELGEHRLQKVESKADIADDPISIERIALQFSLN